MVRRSLLDYFADFTSQDDLFVIHDDGYRVRKITYRQLGQAARAFAERLGEAGVGPDAKVVIWSENSPEWIAALWGCLLRRAVLVPVDYRASADFARRIADIVEARLILAGNEVGTADVAGQVWRLEDVIDIGRSVPVPAPVAAAPMTVEASALAEIVFTSGATADPKGVLITHRNVLANLVPIEQEIAKYRRWERPFHPLRFLNLLPLSHMFGQTMAAFVPPMIGGTVVFSRGYNPNDIVRHIRTRRVSVLVCVPKVLELLRQHVERVAPHTAEPDVLANGRWPRRWWRYRDVHRLFGLKFWCIVCGAAPLDPELESFWRKLGFLVVQGYGLTETTPIVTLNHPLQATQGTVGTPIPGVEVQIAPDGEVLVRGENVTAGYFRPRTGAAALTAEDEAAFRGGWFHTGDIGEFDPHGRLLIKGRKKEMIVTAEGLNVFPEDVERVILAQPGVRDAAVVGVTAGGEERVHAVLVLESGGVPADVVRGANAVLADHQRIWSTSIWPGDALPRTEGTQKLKRRELQRWAAGGSGAAPRPATPTKTVLAIVAGVAGGRAVTPATTLEDLGLGSLDRVELVSALEDTFEVTLDEAEVMATKTVGDLEALVRARAPGTSGPRPPGPPVRTLAHGTPGRPESFPRWARSRWMRGVRYAILTFVALPIVRMFLRLRVEGVEHLVGLEGPVVFAPNHQSHADTPALMIALPARWRYRLAPTMWKEFFAGHFHPERAGLRQRLADRVLYYLACGLFNAFPIPQEEAGTRDTLRYIGEVLAGGDSVLIFPEGQRTEDGTIDWFRPGVGLIGSRFGVPVVPVRLEGLDKVLHRKTWWPRRGPVRVAFGAPLRLKGDDPAALARQVEAAVRRL